MCKKIFSLSIFFFACMMIVFSCCEAEKESPVDKPESKPAPVNPQDPEIPSINSEGKTFTYEVNDTAETLTVTATVTDGGTLSYQWQKSDSADGEYSVIEGETNKDFTPDTSAAGTTYYKCVVTNTLNGKTASAESKVFTVTVSKEEGPVQENPQSPEITTAGGTLAYKVGATADALTITATVTDGGTLSYQWQKSASADGKYTAVSGADKKDFTPDTSVEGTTYYKCVVTNTLNEKTASADSAIFTVVVELPDPEIPSINSEGKTLTYEVNDTAETLTVTATVTDGGTLSYQWQKSASADGKYTAVSGADKKDFTPDTSVAGTTYYKCVVTNTLNEKTASIDSAIFTVTVIEAVEATPPEVNGTKEYTVEINKEVILEVTAKSLDGGELSYKWSKSSDNTTFEELADETKASLVIKPTETGTFYYKCEVTNSVEIDGKTKTAMSEIIITVTVTSGSGNIDIDFN